MFLSLAHLSYFCPRGASCRARLNFLLSAMGDATRVVFLLQRLDALLALRLPADRRGAGEHSGVWPPRSPLGKVWRCRGRVAAQIWMCRDQAKTFQGNIDHQQLSVQDVKDLQEIAQRLPAGHPMQKKLSFLLNA